MLADIALILVAAKLAAELCERVKVPAVVGEIVVGIVIGPSLLGWVDHSEPVTALAELGVLLLLVQVGMEMDLAELGKVGRASLGVAAIGVAAPFVLGSAAGLGFGESGNTALFVGAALTATSVGITARVFGDLRALATTEARIVLGAAVADDVLGLIILTVVVKIVSGGDVDAGAIAGTVGGAIGFVVVATVVGSMAAPAIFGYVARVSRSSATIVVLAFAVMLAFAWAAAEANLAPIIGAFIAGIAIGRTRQHARVERDFGSIANVLIPVFFVQIGIDADLGAMARPAVLGLAGALLVAAIVGKVAAAGGAAGLRVDKLLIGVGMLPRGEVGIIFASIGLAEGVLGDDQYAALLIVVLVTTLMTPPLLRWRIAGARAAQASTPSDGTAGSGSGDWDVAVVADRIVLRGAPSPVHTVPIALEVARLATDATPDASVVDWFGAHAAAPLQWRPADTDGLVGVLRHGDARSLRFLDVTGVLDRALPEVGEALAHRRADPGELDPTRVLQLPTVQQVAPTADRAALLGALVIDVCETGAPDCASKLAERLDPERSAAIADVVAGATMLDRALTNPGVLAEASILQLAHHLGRPDVVADAHALAAARLDDDDWRRIELDEMRDRILTALSHPELRDGDATLVGTRRQAALAALGPGVDQAVAVARGRIENASPSFLVSHEPAELARQAVLAGVLPGRAAVRITVDELPDPGWWSVTVSCRDRPGLLARLTDALAASDVDVASATLTTWPDGGVVDSFVVRSDQRPDEGRMAERMERRLKGRIDLTSLTDVSVSFDDDALPWQTVCTVQGRDRPRLLAATSAALASVKIDVHAATVGPGPDGVEVENRFQVTDRHGRKLDAARRDAIRRAFGCPT